ncbi:MAG: polysaccharide deacetylase family protein [Candidatus Omnitrophica bacterium]|nr:polysaccharide deacetylase family protein [Candidatus Omnitrophota bacterium]
MMRTYKIPLTMQKAILTIAFDDGYLDTYKYGVSYLNRFSIKSTFAVPVGLIGASCERRPVLKWTHLRKIKADGHDIASHSFYHSRTTTELEITRSKQMLERKLKTKISSFVYPYISKLPKKCICDAVKHNYDSSRISKNMPVFNKVPIKNPYNVKGFCVMGKYSLPFLAKQVERAIKEKLWLIEVFHLVGKKNTKSVHRDRHYRFFMGVADFKKHVDFILSKKIKIMTQAEIIKRYGIT